MWRGRPDKPRPEVGDMVLATVGSKDGWGKVTKVVADGCFVGFPPCDYPATMCRPTGTYFIPWEHVFDVRKDT